MGKPSTMESASGELYIYNTQIRIHEAGNNQTVKCAKQLSKGIMIFHSLCTFVRHRCKRRIMPTFYARTWRASDIPSTS